VFLSLIFAVSAIDAATVKVDPASQTVAAGDVFYVNVTVKDVVGMKGDAAILNFDPGVMQVTGIVEGDFLKAGGSTLPVSTWDNTAGTATFGYTLWGTFSTVSGSGTLATIMFDTYPDAPAGTYDLSLTDVELRDASNDEISIDISNGMVTILSPTRTRTSTSGSSGSGIVISDTTGEGTADTNITDVINPIPATTTPDIITDVSANATADTPTPTPSSVPGLSGIDVIAAIGILTILSAIRKRKPK
ncbi:MAG: cohesin domain-containing protein, partial [Euryarchaeota archaeon]|nr:cohesin domain-containing protein [Euryarchaeota archaeon]